MPCTTATNAKGLLLCPAPVGIVHYKMNAGSVRPSVCRVPPPSSTWPHLNSDVGLTVSVAAIA